MVTQYLGAWPLQHYRHSTLSLEEVSIHCFIATLPHMYLYHGTLHTMVLHDC